MVCLQRYGMILIGCLIFLAGSGLHVPFAFAHAAIERESSFACAGFTPGQSDAEGYGSGEIEVAAPPPIWSCNGRAPEPGAARPKACAGWSHLLAPLCPGVEAPVESKRSPVDGQACLADDPTPDSTTEKKVADSVAREKSQTDKDRAHWEDVILFYGDEETGGWSLRIDDKSVTDRAWFEFRELWQFKPDKGRWEHVPTEKYSRAISLPATKGADEPENSQMLYNLEQIPPKTGGLWYAKWRVDTTDGGTLMRIGTSRSHSKKPTDPIPVGMMLMTVPITIEKAEWMLVPDPRTYCVIDGPGKPEGKK